MTPTPFNGPLPPPSNLSLFPHLPFCCNVFIPPRLSCPRFSLCGPEPIKGRFSLRRRHLGRVTSRLRGGQSNAPSVMRELAADQQYAAQSVFICVRVVHKYLFVSQSKAVALQAICRCPLARSRTAGICPRPAQLGFFSDTIVGQIRRSSTS